MKTVSVGKCFPVLQCDLDDHQVDQVTLDAFCKTHGITAW